MDVARRRLVEAVEDAFRGVELGDGVSLHETQVLDAYGTPAERRAARALDEKHDWQKVVTNAELTLIFGVAGGMSFLDAAGVRFYLPACLCRALRDPDGWRVHDMTESLFFHLAQVDEPRDRFAVLDDTQRTCVRDVLLFLVDELGYCDGDLDEAILGYWSGSHGAR